MAEFLQSDLAIGIDTITGNEIKATPYFEDLLFQYLNQMGGEGENLIDQSTNIVNTLPSTLEVKLSKLNKQVAELGQLVESIRKPEKKDLEKRVIELEETNVTPINPLIVKSKKRIDDLEQLVSVQSSENGLLRSILAGLKFTIIEIPTGGTAHTTTGNEIIICNNTGAATITVNATPENREEVHIIKKTGKVSFLSPAGINGKTTTIPILGNYGAPNLIYTSAAGEWSII